jgi:hypothetical protein
MSTLRAFPIVLTLAALCACGDATPPATVSAPATTASAPAATAAPVIAAPAVSAKTTEVAVFKIKVGDCLNGDPTAASAESMDRLDCAAPHLYEAYHVQALTGDSFPGEKSVREQGDSICTAQFAAFVGKSFDDSELTLTAMYPTVESWEQQSDRDILCLITTQDDSKRSGTAKGAKI